MRVLVTGATGFIGSHITSAIVEAGHDVTGCVRSPTLGRRLNPKLSYISCNFSEDDAVEIWLPRLKDIDVVINVVGIITESGANTFERVHYNTPKALFDACKQVGTKKVIQISALGVSDRSNTPYNNTKMKADEYLQSLGILFIILRPSWLYGLRSRSFELLCAFAALPVIPLLGQGQHKVQAIFIDDLAQAVAKLLTTNALDNQIVEAGGPSQLPIRSIFSKLRTWLGMGKGVFLPTPLGLGKQFVKIGDYVFKGPVNTASFDMLTRHNITDDYRLWKNTGVAPHSLDAALAQSPSVPAHQWHARLFFIIPGLRYALAFMWMASAIIPALMLPKESLMELFHEVGIRGTSAEIGYWGTLAVDFLLGLTLLFNFKLSLFGSIQIAVIILYTLVIAIQAPHWLLHPYGAIVKNIPLIFATWVVISSTRKR